MRGRCTPSLTATRRAPSSSSTRATRPVYVLYGSPEDQSAGDQRCTTSRRRLARWSSTSGAGTRFIGEAGVDVLDVSTAKHPVTRAMGGILAVASGETNRTYYHGWIPAGRANSDAAADPGTRSPISARPKFKNDIIWAWTRESPPAARRPVLPEWPGDAGQMATFLVRALDLPRTSIDYFTDDEATRPRDQHQPRCERQASPPAARRRASAPTASCPGADGDLPGPRVRPAGHYDGLLHR